MSLLRTLLVVLLAAVGSAAAAIGVADRKTSASRVVLSEAQLRKYNALYLESVCQREAGNYVAQYRLLDRAIRLNPNGADALFDMAQLALDKEIDVHVDEYLERAHALQPDNVEFSYELAVLWLALDDEKGVELMKTLLDNADRRDDAYAQLCAYYEIKYDYENLCDILERWRPIKDDDEFISSNKMNSAMNMGRYEDVLLIADTLLARNSLNAVSYKFSKADALLALGRTQEVEALADSLRRNGEELSNLNLLSYRLALSTKNTELERSSLEAMVLDPEMLMQTRLAAFKAYVEKLPNNERTAGRDSLVARLLNVSDDDATLLRRIGEQMENEHVADSAMIPIYTKLLEVDPSDELIRLHLMQHCLANSDYEELAKLSTDGLKENPKHPLFYYFAGVRLQIEKNDSAAIQLYERGLQYVDESTHTELVSSYYSAYADALHQLGRNSEAYAMYDSALVYNADNIMCLNNYAYFLSLDNIELRKAERMSRKTIQLEPEMATYLDTYAWICFLLEDYNNARKYVDLTIKYTEDPEDPENATLYEHAGDIYFHLGMIDKALAFWRHAQRLDDSSPLLQKKIQNKRYFKE